MHKVRVLNNISSAGLQRFGEAYQVGGDCDEPDVILLRSFNMWDMALPHSVLAVGRAGAGVNNIPVEQLSRRGIAVFNAPGANANAVKELVIAGMLLAARNICQSWDYTRGLQGTHEEVEKQVELGKKRYAGIELPGRTLGVIGLGYIGRQVANAAVAMGMRVIGYDPGLTVDGAWRLDTQVERAISVEQLLSRAQFVTFHVPLSDSTRGLLNDERLALLPKGATVLNFARAGIVDDTAVLAALDAGDLHAYVCDFPTPELLAHPGVIALPHLGASTVEAEENCAVMVVDQVMDYLERGNVTNSVNFPDLVLPLTDGFRLCVVNSNVPNMVGQITTALAGADLNIVDMLNKSRGDLAYTVVDVDKPLPAALLEEVGSIDGVLSIRAL